MSEWPFIISTVTVQCAIGTFLVLALIEILVRPPIKAMGAPFFAVLIMLAIGTGASVLVEESQSLRVFMPGLSLGSVILPSLDVLALILFSCSVFLYIVARALNTTLPIQILILLPCTTFGIVLLLAISQSYSPMPAPLESNIWTAFQFIVTTLVTGPIAVITLLYWRQDHISTTLLQFLSKRLAIISLLAMTLTQISFTIYLFWIGTLHLPDNPLFNIDNGYLLVSARIVLTLASVQILAISTLCGKSSTLLASLCLILLLLAETSGRAFFFFVHQETTLVSSERRL